MAVSPEVATKMSACVDMTANNNDVEQAMMSKQSYSVVPRSEKIELARRLRRAKRRLLLEYVEQGNRVASSAQTFDDNDSLYSSATMNSGLVRRSSDMS